MLSSIQLSNSQASAPGLFAAPGPPSVSSPPSLPMRGAERRETRGRARPSERPTSRPTRLIEACPLRLRSGEAPLGAPRAAISVPVGRASGRATGRLAAFLLGRLPPPFAARRVQPLKADPHSGAGRLAGASREWGYKPRPRAPPPAPPSVCLRKTPLGGWDDRTISRSWE